MEIKLLENEISLENIRDMYYRVHDYYEHNCRECIMSSSLPGYNLFEDDDCRGYLFSDGERYVEILKKWNEEHKFKTNKELFWEKYEDYPWQRCDNDRCSPHGYCEEKLPCKDCDWWDEYSEVEFYK